MAKLTVVVPVYNVEDYLEWCLDSITAQTYQDIEVICVNDGTKDRSRDIATRYVETDPRFIIVDKPNGGLSSARNAGIRAATSPYVCFVDSDDRITLDACEKIVAAFESTDADVITYGANCYPASAGYDWLTTHLSPRDIEYNGFSPDLIFKEMSRPYAWRTACKKSFLVDNGLFFDEGLLFGEDQAFHFAIYPRAPKTLLMSDKLYDYRVTREGSLMHSVYSDSVKKMAEHINIIRHIYNDWAAAGFLKQYPVEMVAWTVEFALFAIATQLDPPRNDLVNALREAWLTHFSEKEILGLGLPWATKNMVRAALLNPDRFNGISGKILRRSYSVEQNGLREGIRKLLLCIGFRKKTDGSTH